LRNCCNFLYFDVIYCLLVESVCIVTVIKYLPAFCDLQTLYNIDVGLFCLSEYLQVVRSALDEVDSKCPTEISSATLTIQSMLTTEAGRTKLKSQFR